MLELAVASTNHRPFWPGLPEFYVPLRLLCSRLRSRLGEKRRIEGRIDFHFLHGGIRVLRSAAIGDRLIGKLAPLGRAKVTPALVRFDRPLHAVGGVFRFDE